MLFVEIGRIVRINHTYVNHTYTYVPIYHQASSSLLSTDFRQKPKLTHVNQCCSTIQCLPIPVV